MSLKEYIRTCVVVVVLVLFGTVLPALAVTDGKLDNPLSKQFSDIPKFIEGFLRAIVIIALPLITIFIVYAGFLFIKARGNSSELTDAKKNFYYVIIGAILILSAWVLATLIGGTVTQLLSK